MTRSRGGAFGSVVKTVIVAFVNSREMQLEVAAAASAPLTQRA